MSASTFVLHGASAPTVTQAPIQATPPPVKFGAPATAATEAAQSKAFPTVAGAAAACAFGFSLSSRKRQQQRREKQARSRAVRQAASETDYMMSTVDRALAVNLNPDFYGSFAEIGAGQEVSRWFLRAGAAAGTVARTVSAYDMQMSDRMYGEAKRYVTKERMKQMLEQEYQQIEDTLRAGKGDCRFFSFASTIAAKAFKSDRECEGWLGLLYQKNKGEKPSTVWLHARMTDPTAQMQADKLGVLGTNLVYLCSDASRSHVDIIKHLMDNIDSGISINWVDFSGPGWEEVDDRHVAFYLVMYNLAEAVVFNPLEGKSQLMEPTVPNLAFYKRPLVVQRGRFRFVSKVNEAIFDASVKKLKAESEDDKVRDPMPVIEMNMKTIGRDQRALNMEVPSDALRDFVSRFNVLSSMRAPILISGMQATHRLTEYILRYTNQKVIVAVGGGSYSIERGIFRESEAEGLSGGLLEAFGKIFAKDAQLYVFPNISDEGEISPGAESKSQDVSKSTLLDHLKATGRIVEIEKDYIDSQVLDPATNGPYRKEVQGILNMLCRADDRWTEYVPDLVVETVKKRGISEVLGTLNCAVDAGATTISPLDRFYENYVDGN